MTTQQTTSRGLDMYEAGNYDMVALDHNMPVYDGLEVIPVEFPSPAFAGGPGLCIRACMIQSGRNREDKSLFQGTLPQKETLGAGVKKGMR